MGQSTGAVEEALMNLETRSTISPAHVRLFMEDYQNADPKLNDVDSFLEHPSLQIYLKYFINNRYIDPKARQRISTLLAVQPSCQ